MTLSAASATTSAPGFRLSAPPLLYDGAGDLVNDGTNAYLYDGEGRICAVASNGSMTGYLYDAAGNRVAKGTITSWSCDASPNSNGVANNGFSQTAGYVVGPSGEQLTEVDGSGNWLHTNIYAGGKLIGTYDGSVSAPTLHFHIDDPLGTRRAQVSATGVLEATYQSLPFGDGLNPIAYTTTADDPTENHFTGKERDTESGNDYMFARYYNSATGRFLSPDWSAKYEPVPYAKLGNPQTLNLYAYIDNNPLGGTDPDGHDDIESNAIEDTWNALGLDAYGHHTEMLADEVQNETEESAEANASAFIDAAERQQGQQQGDVTPGQGEQILIAAESYEGTPYKSGGNSKKGIDCSHLVCDALNKVGIAVMWQHANDFTQAVNLRALKPGEQPRSGDIVIWKHNPTGHVGVYDGDPSKPGYNIVSATDHGVMHSQTSSFSTLGTPTYYRVEVGAH
jgi:RHS repeat-associated protein